MVLANFKHPYIRQKGAQKQDATELTEIRTSLDIRHTLYIKRSSWSGFRHLGWAKSCPDFESFDLGIPLYINVLVLF